MVKIKDKAYHLIISDFDGTLAGKDKVIAKRVKEAIRKLKTYEVPFIIASGRNFFGIVEDTCRELELTSPQITAGGSEIVDPKNRKVLSAEYIPDGSIKKLFSFLTEKKIDFWIEKDFIMYTQQSREYLSLGPSQYKPLTALNLTRVPKLGIFPVGDNRLGAQIEELLKDQFNDLHITKSFSPVAKSWDITAAMGNKQEAVLKVSRMLKIPTEEIIGIGDGYNDFPLLEACGFGVAMGNANDELKKIADQVVPSYQEDGVAVFINELLAKQSNLN